MLTFVLGLGAAGFRNVLVTTESFVEISWRTARRLWTSWVVFLELEARVLGNAGCARCESGVSVLVSGPNNEHCGKDDFCSEAGTVGE